MPFRLMAVLLTVLVSPLTIQGEEPSARILLQPADGGLHVSLPAQSIPPVGGTRIRLHLESSEDLRDWSERGELDSSDDGPAALRILNDAAYQFFRIRSEIEDLGSEPDGAELLGYDRVFKEELKKAGFLNPQEFVALHIPSLEYVQQLTFDPATAKFWEGFDTDPAVHNASLPPGSLDKRLYDFRLNAAELAIFKTNGFVVSERLGSYSFADLFYRLFTDDLPVFVSADAVLHAWHFSYQRLLEEAEETQLAPALKEILDGMHAELAQAPAAVRGGPLAESLDDADYYLTVARSLLGSERVGTVFGMDSVESDVSGTLDAVSQLQFVMRFPIFGSHRMFDFSQFRVRGHYERSPQLGHYFQAFMWTARVDFRLLAAKSDAQSLRELGTAVVLSQLLEKSGQAARWQQLDEVIRLFVGRPDAMTFAQFQPLLAAFGIRALESVGSVDQLQQLQQAIVQGRLGLQLIPGDACVSPFGQTQLQLPRAFVLTGQRFNPDGWALGQVIFDRIMWNEEIPGYTFFGKVIRRFPSALDMAYSVLGNRQIGLEIGHRMLDVANRTNLRDGLPYAHNLAALAATFDRISPAAWEDSIYTRWLAALRELSVPTTDARFPEAMRTRAWSMRTLNTQLASYTELKHDTVLYAKQPYTAMILCEYPAGFVEPVPSFWKRMKELAEATATGLDSLPASGTIRVPKDDPVSWENHIEVDLAQRRAARVNFCRSFAQQMTVLETLAAKELQQQAFSDAETLFLRSLMNRRDQPYFGPTFDGWYPGLFYKDYGQLIEGGPDSNGSNKSDPLVTDVQTAPPDEFDPAGGVLHQATGNIDLLMIAVDNGPDRMVYAGPVLSHYEFIVPGPTLKRLTDSEWGTRFPRVPTQTQSVVPPARPDWTRSYLVPK